ncbi:2'-5' RNA ligase family protein [Segeticoccus rhizosphaerae]|jgi:2'-5' RNA ligase|uniref:2'-5' RNA ligase family protein n=2 Tax=Segeticoccus rhizosphaerae TaxID=1104777 RepID=UPI0010BF929B|nr:2'-5' RNA ligase family protein [Ornithinicoccus soli]
MSLAVCLLFDRRGESALRRLWAALEAQGIRSLASHTHGRHHPHISYAVLLDWDLEAVRDRLGRLPDGGPFELRFHGVVAFPRGRACLVPAVTSEVMQRQEAVSEAVVGTGATLHRHYRRGDWVPHCSLSPRATGALLPVAVRMATDALPLTVRVERAALIDSGTGQSWELPGIP